MFDGHAVMLQVNPEKALAAKNRGNELYGKGQYEEAINAYSDALSYSAEDDAENRAVYLGNRAACYTMMVKKTLVALKVYVHVQRASVDSCCLMYVFHRKTGNSLLKTVLLPRS